MYYPTFGSNTFVSQPASINFFEQHKNTFPEHRLVFITAKSKCYSSYNISPPLSNLSPREEFPTRLYHCMNLTYFQLPSNLLISLQIFLFYDKPKD